MSDKKAKIEKFLDAVQDDLDTDTEGTEAKTIVLAEQNLPSVLYLVPVDGRPVFPSQGMPVRLDADIWAEPLKRLGDSERPVVGMIYQGDNDEDDWLPDELPKIGCVARLVGAHVEDDDAQVLIQGLKRFRIVRWLNESAPYLVEVEYPQNSVHLEQEQMRAYGMALINSIKELLPLNPLYSEELKNYLQQFSPSEPSMLADFAAAITSASGDDLQDVLETIKLPERIEKVLVLINKEKEVAKLQQQISEEVNIKIGDTQREFFLREQLKVIQKELGISKDDKTSDKDEFHSRLEGKVLPEAIMKRLDEEMNKLSMLEPGSAEYAVTRNFLDWATCLPWGLTSEDKLDISHARATLDKHHDGLLDVKDRIIEFIALARFKGQVAGSIILLVGPPGVGKTSIGRSIAEALGREFFRFSLGGMRDEAEIKGHRRTYIGAMPGKLIQALKDAGTENPVIMLDEIDKIGSSFQGDPASALLEVLDPEQNNSFLDHYLDMRVDLSKVLFVCTANQLDTIPGPLLDRMEVIRLAGYIAEEKVEIAKNHLWPKLLKRNSIPSSRLKINKTALRAIVEGYAREAGVRSLEKLLARIVRKAAVKLLADDDLKLTVSKNNVEDFLGKAMFSKDVPERGVGVVTGLAWTSLGGTTLPVQCTRVPSKNRGLKLTGQLGDVMKESAEIAYSYVLSNLDKFDLSVEFFDNAIIHLHVPEGATPKDGPSAGVTMCSALISLAKSKAISKPLAMTGELTLTGSVLPVGGIKEKVIAARRAGIKTVVLPKENQKDYEELPDYLKEKMTAHFSSEYEELFELLF